MQGFTRAFQGAGTIDRAAAIRGDDAALARQWDGDAGLCLPLWRGNPAVDGPRLAPRPCAEMAGAGAAAPLFLGLVDGRPWFAAELDDAAVGPEAEAGFADLRAIMAGLDAAEAELAATARALANWHRTHRFCAACGAQSLPAQGGWQRRCPDCGALHFPRTDPVVIMLVLHGNDLLLGRSPDWPEGMFSLLAGFMEPGETIEAAVRREVAEETAVPVSDVAYVASQPWPFPSSLMIGCAAVATGRDIRIDPVELEAALWMPREDLVRAFAGTHPQMRPPRRGSISAFLMAEWLAGRVGPPPGRR